MTLFLWVWGAPALLTSIYITWITTDEIVAHHRAQQAAIAAQRQPQPNVTANWVNIFLQSVLWFAYWVGIARQRWLLNG